MKVGTGWKYLGSTVWERDGLRIHVSGLCRLQDGTVIVGTSWPESKRLDWLIRVHGGNRRRGCMAWANERQEARG